MSHPGGPNNPHGNPGNPGNTQPTWRTHARRDLSFVARHWRAMRGWIGDDARAERGNFVLVVAENDALTPFHVHLVADPERTQPPSYKSTNAEHAARWIEAQLAGLSL